MEGFSIHRLLIANGIESHVVDAASMAVPGGIGGPRRIRSTARRWGADGLGSRRTAGLLHGSRAERGRRGSPSPDARARHLLKERIQHTIGSKACSAAKGSGITIRFAAIVSSGSRGWNRRRARAAVDAEGGNPPGLERIAVVTTQLAAVERARDALICTDAKEPNNPAGMLLKLKGLGPELASLLSLESLFRSFANRRQVAAYGGLAPSPWQSGGVERDQGISKSGNRRLRKTMIELAWFWLRHQPDSALSRWFRARLAPRKDGSAGSPSWRWPANCSSPCGALSPKASFPRARYSSRPDPMVHSHSNTLTWPMAMA